MKVTTLFCLLLLYLLPSAFASLDKERNNRIIHRDKNLKINRGVNFTWHSYPQNLIAYTDHAGATEKNQIYHDEEIDINITYAEVIELNQASFAPYNGLIAYIIQTADGRWFIKYQMPVEHYAYDVPTESAHLYFPQQGMELAHIGGTLEGNILSPYYHFSGSSDTARKHADSMPSSMMVKKEVEYYWVTVEIFPNTEQWNQQLRKLNISDLHSNYTVVEYTSFKQ